MDGDTILLKAAGSPAQNIFGQGDAKRQLYAEVAVVKAHDQDNSVIQQVSTAKIPANSVITKVVAVVKTASNLSTHLKPIKQLTMH